MRDRDPSTLAHFCDYFYLPIRNKVRHRFPRDVSDDLVQDVFVAALTRIDAGEPEHPQKLACYLFGICDKLILRVWRRERFNNPVVDFDPSLLPDARDRADIQLMKHLDERRVHRTLENLSSPRDRDALNRVYLLQEDRETVAREMGISRTQLRVILCRALQRFRDGWDNNR